MPTGDRDTVNYPRTAPFRHRAPPSQTCPLHFRPVRMTDAVIGLRMRRSPLSRRGLVRRARSGVALATLVLATSPLAGQASAGRAGSAVAAAQAPSAAPGAEPIGKGDRIVLRVWREPSWSDSTSVDLAGDVTLPRIGTLRAAGVAPDVFRDTVRARFAVYLREPVIDLIVLRRVTVQGAVRKPDVLYVEPVMSLREIIARAGGVDEEGDPNRIEILRDGTRIRLGRWRDVATASQLVHSGDQVIVGRRGWLARNALTAVSSLAVAVSVLVTALRR